MRAFKTAALLFVTVSSLLQGLATAQAQAGVGVVSLTAFTLNKREAGKGETVSAMFQLTAPASSVRITATNFDGGPIGFEFPQTASLNASHTAGTIAFSVPSDAGTLSPLLIQLNIDGQLRGLNTLQIKCDTPWFFSPRVERCPFDKIAASPAAVQHFEHGAMLWLQATNSVYVLFNIENTGYAINSYQLMRVEDMFKAGMPETDPNIKAPFGKFQPIRGFGKVWRENPMVMNALGWAMDKERGYTACFGQAFGGSNSMRSYISTPAGELLELESFGMPVGWRVLRTIGAKPVSLHACR